jgi:hypothetical protein
LRKPHKGENGEINMADYSMNDEDWNKRKNKVTTYLESHDLGDMEQVIQWNLNQGDTNEENRKRFWTSITTLFGMLPDSPISRGRESDLPEEVQQSITTVAVSYAEAYTAAFASHPLFGEVVRKHGKSGGGTYANNDEYNESLQKQMRGRLTGYYRNHIKNITDKPSWNGTLIDGIPTILQPVVEGGDEEE